MSGVSNVDKKYDDDMQLSSTSACNNHKLYGQSNITKQPSCLVDDIQLESHSNDSNRISKNFPLYSTETNNAKPDETVSSQLSLAVSSYAYANAVMRCQLCEIDISLILNECVAIKVKGIDLRKSTGLGKRQLNACTKTILNFKTNSRQVQQQQHNNTSNTCNEDITATQDNIITDNTDNVYPPTPQPPAGNTSTNYYSNKWHSPEAINHFLGRSRAKSLPLDQTAVYPDAH